MQEDGATVVQYDVDAKVGGKLAQIGSRLIDSTAKKLAKQFFDSLAEKLGGGEKAETEAEPAQETEAASPAEPVPTSDPAPASPEPAKPPSDAPSQDAPAPDAGPPLPRAEQRKGLPTVAWAAAVVVVAVVLILVSTGVI